MTPGQERWLARLGAAVVGLVAMSGYELWRKVYPDCTFSEWATTLESIRVAEEAYRYEAGTYLGCDARGAHTSGGDLATAPLYPRPIAELDARKVGWGAGATSHTICLQTLNPRLDGPVRYAYSVVAHGGPEPWFEARAVGDPDGDGNHVEYRFSSRSQRIETIDDDD